MLKNLKQFVAANTTQQITVSGAGNEAFGLALGSDKDLDLVVYRQDDGSTQAEVVQTVPNWLDYSAGFLNLVGGTWEANPLTLDTFDGGATYYIVVANGSGLLDLGVNTSITVQTDSSVLTTFNFNAQEVVGNVLTNDGDTKPSTIVSLVDDVSIMGETTISGQYGNLTISSDGAYTYTPNANSDAIGKTDEFEYTIDNGNGNVDLATLSIDITSQPISARTSLSSFDMSEGTGIELPDISLMSSSEGLSILSFESADQVISLADLIQPETIDIIDISGIGANTLNITAADIDSAIYVKGDDDDTINLEGDSWSTVGQTSSGGEMYDVWQSVNDTSTQIYIDTTVNVI